MFFLIRSAAFAAICVFLTLPAMSVAQSASGSYLAGRHAGHQNDFAAAAQYFSQSLLRDPENGSLMESAALAQLALGRIDRAVSIAEIMEEMGLQSQVAHMAVIANLIAEGEYQAVLDRDSETRGIGRLVDGLLEAWALMGTGAVSKALAKFDEVGDLAGFRGFSNYHKALALASVGDFEGAERIYADDPGLVTITRRGGVARAEILSQLDRNGEASQLLADAFGTRFEPMIGGLVERLAADEKLPFTQVTSPRDGMAEVFFTIGGALRGEVADDYALLYARIAAYLRPDHHDAILLGASLLDDLGQYDLAVAAYKQIPQASPDHYAAELGRAEALRRAAKPDAAIEVLEQLTRDYPGLPMVHSALGDLLRQQEDYAAAVPAYDKALEHTEAEAPGQWFLHYARGISYERLKQWEQAEADFRRALDLNPDQPQVLNYLGYSMVEKHINLDEALDMIERAVASRPDSGYIVDSLGWVLFRLGRYQEAVEHMERAVELMPVDPVVNDHLGDVYWSVGRIREAEFQWKRALSFIDPEDTDGEADPDRIRRKLEVGLDLLLQEEGADPLKVANDG